MLRVRAAVGRSSAVSPHQARTFAGPFGVIWLAMISGCDRPDLTIDGQDFHVSNAYIQEFTSIPAGEQRYDAYVANVSDVCALLRSSETARPVDDVWFEMSTSWSRRDGASPEFLGATICVGGYRPCSSTGGRRLWTTGDGLVEVGAWALRLAFDVTHDDQGPLDESFHVDLELPYTTCQ